MKENKYQSKLIKRIKSEFPDAIVLKNDSNYIQGIPDLTILNGDRWAMLEVKKDGDSSRRPNQEYYVNKANQMSYASFIDPSNEEDIFHELQSALTP